MRFACLLALIPVALLAHHSIDAKFVRSESHEYRGKVARIEWVNPHVRFWLDVTRSDGSTVQWEFELGAPRGLLAAGWTRDTLVQGDVVTVTAHPEKNGAAVGSVVVIVLADGSRVENHDEWNMWSAAPPKGVPTLKGFPK
jgi:hypothetical protein